MSQGATPQTTARPDESIDEVAATWRPLAVLLAATFMTFLDFFIVNVALPSMRRDLEASPTALSFVVTGYALTFAVGMITGGRLGDRHGRRLIFTIGLALFTLASAVSGLAPDIATLNVARMLQGAAGALLTPQVLAMIGVIYTGPRRTRAFAAYGFAMGIAGVLGQLLGGLLIAADPWGLGWRLIFLINVPVGIAALLITRRVIPETFGMGARLDLAGLVLLTAALSLVVLTLVEGPSRHWPWWSWTSLVVAAVLLVGLVTHQRARRRRGRAPLIDLDLFAVRSFVAGEIVTITFTAIPPSLFFVLAIYLQQGRGMSALASGILFSSVGAGYFLAILCAGRIAARVGHGVLSIGSVVSAAGLVLLRDAAHSPIGLLVPGLAVVGAGIGLVLVPLTSTVLARVTPEQAGSGAGVLATTQQLAGALGVAVISTVFFSADDVVSGFALCTAALAALGMVSALATRLLRAA